MNMSIRYDMVRRRVRREFLLARRAKKAAELLAKKRLTFTPDDASIIMRTGVLGREGTEL